MSAYFHETPRSELVQIPLTLARQVAEWPATTWEVSCACDPEENYVCPECGASALETKPAPRRRLRWLRLGRKETA